MFGRIQILSLLALVLVGTCAFADTVHLRNGETLQGTLEAESYTISTPDRGDLHIPLTSIAAMRFQNEREVEVELVDGRTLRGSFAAEQFVLAQDLFSTTLAMADIARVTIEERTEAVTIPEGTAVRLMLADWLHSRSVELGDVVPLCVSDDVELDGRLAIPRGTPATGKIITARQARRMSQRGEIAIEPEYLTPGEEKRIPIRGASAEFEGGLDAGAFVVAGVLGFLASGEDVKVPPEQTFDVVTSADAEAVRPPRGNGARSDAWRHCEEFFRFADAETVPLEEADLHAAYAPFGTSLAVSLPLAELAELREGETLDRAPRNLVAFDTSIQTLVVSVDEGRRRVKLPMRIFLGVLPSHDKRVDMTVSVLDGDDTIVQEVRKDIDAEEEKTKQVRLTLAMPRERFEQAAASGEGRLRVTISVRE